MKRNSSGTRLPQIIESATRTFCEKGYAQTQMADVAKLAGVASGTLYLYVKSKEALFDLVVRHGIEAGDKNLPTEFPVADPAPGATLKYLKQALSKGAKWSKLQTALATPISQDPTAEVTAVIEELYALDERNRWGLLVLASTASEFPGLAEMFLREFRAKLIADLTTYFRVRVASGQFRALPNPEAAAAFVCESVAWAVLHRMGDPVFKAIADEQMKSTTIHMLVGSLVATKSRTKATFKPSEVAHDKQN